MDKRIPMHKELAMGMKSAQREAVGKAPGADKKVVKMKKGGLAKKDCKCEGGMVK